MSYKQMTGNIISATKVEPDGFFNNSAASGVWSLQEAFDYTKGGNWPIVGFSSSVGLFGGGLIDPNKNTKTNVIEKVIISTSGSGTDFGDLSVARAPDGLSSITRGVFTGGMASTTTMDFVTITTLGNATDFGDLSSLGLNVGSCSSQTRGLNLGFGGYGGDVIDYITIASAGNATDFGNLSVARAQCMALSSPTRGVAVGGNLNDGSGSESNVIDYVTIASTGNATDFGNCQNAMSQGYSVASNTKGVTVAGIVAGNYSNVIDIITIASTGNATDFGNASVAAYNMSGVSNRIYGLFSGGDGESADALIDNIQYITIASAGNTSDFGDLTAAKKGSGGCSSGHGGLAA